MPIHHSGESYHVLLVVEGVLANDNRIHLVGWHTKVSSSSVSDSLLFGKRRACTCALSFQIGVDDLFRFPMPLENMLDLMSQHEPEVVDFILACRHPNDRLAFKPKAYPVNVSVRKLFDDYESYAAFGQNLGHLS